MNTTTRFLATATIGVLMAAGLRSQIRPQPSIPRPLPPLPPTVIPRTPNITPTPASPSPRPLSPSSQTVQRSSTPSSGGGGDPPPPIPIFVVAPVPVSYQEDFKDAIERVEQWLDYYEFFRGDGKPTGKIDAWLQSAAKNKPTFIVVPMRRAEAIENLQVVAHKSLSWVNSTLDWQIRRITPFEWESQESKSEKLALVRRAEQEKKAVMKAAAEEANSGKNWTHIETVGSKSTFRYTPGPAHKQAIEIARTGAWNNQ